MDKELLTEGRWRVHLQNVFFFYPFTREKLSSFSFNLKNVDEQVWRVCLPLVNHGFMLLTICRKVTFIDGLSDQSFVKAGLTFFFKCWIHHFGTKLFDCKLYPGGANARRHPNALALKKAVWLQEPEKKKLRNIQVWNGKNVTLYSTHLCTHTRTLTHTHARI